MPACQAGARRQSLSTSPVLTREEKSSESSFPSTFLYLVVVSFPKLPTSLSSPHETVALGHPAVLSFFLDSAS